MALPGVDAEEKPRLTIRDAESLRVMRWGGFAIIFGEQRKDNPKAKNARFRVDNVVVGDMPIEIYVNDKKVAEIVVSRPNVG